MTNAIRVGDNLTYSSTDSSGEKSLRIDSGEGVALTDLNTLMATFTDMLKELKKMNLHLSVITDLTIKNTEVE